MARRRAAAGLLIVAVLVGCSGGGRDEAKPSPGGATATPARVPQVGECRGPISKEIFGSSFDARPTVPCEQVHGSETVFVAQLSAALAGLPHDRISAMFEVKYGTQELDPILSECEVAFERYVGETRFAPDASLPTNLSLAFFMPSSDEWAAGGRWVRCDAVTEPFTGQEARGTTESLRGIAARDPRTPWRLCFNETSRPEPRDQGRSEGSSFTSCDQPHNVEEIMRIRVADPKVDMAADDTSVITSYLTREFGPRCVDRAAAHLGLSRRAMEQREDIKLSVHAINPEAWPTSSRARAVACRATTQEPTVGTLEGLGRRPLVRS